MSSFEFGQIEVASNEFLKQRQVTNIFIIDVKKVLVSDKMSHNNRKDWRYIVGYQAFEETMIPLFTKTPENVFSYGVSPYYKNIPCKMSFEYF